MIYNDCGLLIGIKCNVLSPVLKLLVIYPLFFIVSRFSADKLKIISEQLNFLVLRVSVFTVDLLQYKLL